VYVYDYLIQYSGARPVILALGLHCVREKERAKDRERERVRQSLRERVCILETHTALFLAQGLHVNMQHIHRYSVPSV